LKATPAFSRTGIAPTGLYDGYRSEAIEALVPLLERRLAEAKQGGARRKI
jgi:hypothetical protein